MYEYEIKIAFYCIALLVLLIVVSLPEDIKEKAKKFFHGVAFEYLYILFTLQVLGYIVILGGLFYGTYWLTVNGHPILGIIAFVLLIKFTVKIIVKFIKHLKDKRIKNGIDKQNK